MILAVYLYCHLQTSPSAVPWMRRYSTFWKFFALAITVEFCWEEKWTVQQLQFKTLSHRAERLSLPSRTKIKQWDWQNNDSNNLISIWDYNRICIYLVPFLRASSWKAQYLPCTFPEHYNPSPPRQVYQASLVLRISVLWVGMENRYWEYDPKSLIGIFPLTWGINSSLSVSRAGMCAARGNYRLSNNEKKRKAMCSR